VIKKTGHATAITQGVVSLLLKAAVYTNIIAYSISGSIIGYIYGRETLLAHLRDRYVTSVLKTLDHFGVKVTVEGDTSCLVDGALVLAPHESILDTIFGHMAVLGGRPAYLAQDKYFNIWLFGTCMKIAGMLPITPNKLKRSTIKQVRQRLAEHRTVIVFPEGARTQPPHTNVMGGSCLFVKQALQMGRPVVGIHFGDSYNVWGPPHTYLTARPQNIVIHVTEPLDSAELGTLSKDCTSLLQYIRTKIY
jgi:1-acyl-sn-glycerol-3-phosphate acyltransferase